MYGSVVSLRSRARLFGCAIALVALSAMMLTPGIASAAKEKPATTTYLALGDVVGFGQTEEGFKNNESNESPSFFEEGYANDLAKDLQKSTELGKGLTLVNDSCPSDTTNTFIGENEAIGGKVSTEPAGPSPDQGEFGDYHPCSYHQLQGFPLHNSFGDESQLEEALGTLNEGHPAHEVKLITVELGAQDELAGIAKCEAEVEQEFKEIEKEGGNDESPGQYGYGREESFALCVITWSVQGTKGQEGYFPHIVKNLNTILTELTGSGPGEGHYTGPIVLGGYYNPDSESIPGSDSLQKELNKLVEKEVVPNFPNVTFANPFTEINPQTTEAKEKKSICKYTEMCNPNVQKKATPEQKYYPAGEDGDINPSPAGAKLIAEGMNEAYLANPAR
jgi:hypothetical protein